MIETEGRFRSPTRLKRSKGIPITSSIVLTEEYIIVKSTLSSEPFFPFSSMHRTAGMVAPKELPSRRRELAAPDGAEPKEDVQGESFWPLVRGEQSAFRDHAVCAYSDMACVWEGDYLYTRNLGEGTERLYNVEDDPVHTQDLAAEMPERVGHMAARLLDLLGQELRRQPA